MKSHTLRRRKSRKSEKEQKTPVARSGDVAQDIQSTEREEAQKHKQKDGNGTLREVGKKLQTKSQIKIVQLKDLKVKV